ncbi:MAG: hypothetical protein CMB56_001665 [Methanobacteriota archaeon]|nr:MAG: hypothetical protein CMB56_001665 [Euryarchaeota archaeon]|tara:strand:- start:1469 stop:2374 length:906 start_codon:yes stop_codon:yes gene_type:complete
MDDERKRKLASLRSRVRSQIRSGVDTSSSPSKENGLLQKASSKLKEQIIDETEDESLTISLSRFETEFKRFASTNEDNETLRSVAALCILIGAVLGIVSGMMQLTGNPAELMENSQFFAIDDDVSISGIVLYEDGNEFGGVSIKIYDLNTGKSYGEEITGSNGIFLLPDVPQRPMRMEFKIDGYETVNIVFIPDQATYHYITMHEGEATREIGEITDSNLNQVVVVGTIVGIFSILFALLGVHAYLEVKRAKYYRRTMYIAGLSMFSRGLIFVGPTFTLIGMAFLTLTKKQFRDQNSDNDV